MKKLLYVTFDNSQAYSGGSQCARRNLQSLKDILGEEKVITYYLKPDKSERKLTEHLQRSAGIIKGYLGGLTDEHRKNILNIILKDNVTELFIDSSQLGLLAKYAKRAKPSIRIHTFFHNIEFDFFKSNVIDCKNYGHFFWIPMAKANERNACRYSDNVIVLNNKDKARLEQLYKRKADAIIPISMTDDYVSDFQQIPNTKKRALFVGSYFFGNTKGLLWLCNDILPHTNIHLTIVGAGMDAFAHEINQTEQISVFSNVADLVPYYAEADFVILPIITGGGMKVKTAEALKYGKYIIGTREALEGYDTNSDVATVCHDTQSFIKAIQEFHAPYKFNVASRKLFVEKYSYEASLVKFKAIIKQ